MSAKHFRTSATSLDEDGLAAVSCKKMFRLPWLCFLPTVTRDGNEKGLFHSGRLKPPREIALVHNQLI